MTDQTPEEWADEMALATERFTGMLGLDDLPNTGGLSLDALSLEVPAAPSTSIPVANPLDVSDAEAAQVHLGHGLTTKYFGAVADGYAQAVNVGRANGILAPKKRWPWQR